MNTPHKHADWIKRWADGEAIEWSWAGDVWKPVQNEHNWDERLKYRAQKQKRRYRVARAVYLDGKPFTHSVDDEEEARDEESQKSFVCWLTDWIEYE